MTRYASKWLPLASACLLLAACQNPQAPAGRHVKPRMSEAEMLRHRVRYFVDGMVVGSRGFVDAVFGLTPDWFGGKRTSGARKLRQAATALRSMRSLRVSPYR